MTADTVTMIMSEALFMVITVSAPLLLVSLIVGLVVSIFQTVTSIHEQTLTFVPKIISVFLTLMILGNWMITKITDYITILWHDFTLYIK
ncbi:MAG: flagellar biosynthesis protein FliQ [Butyrivibrio sp.]|jgi:flagellar biosynthetic protein FliQ|nr:flagellar biosynthesis protein FliQ [Butyrivibrio sp.]